MNKQLKVQQDAEFAEKYDRQYSEQGFWLKIRKFGAAAGRDVVEKALLLYYAAQQDSVPKWAKATIVGALGYFIAPVDAIVDITPAVGYADDLGVLAMALTVVATHIDDTVRQKAQQKSQSWFGKPESEEQ